MGATHELWLGALRQAGMMPPAKLPSHDENDRLFLEAIAKADRHHASACQAAAEHFTPEAPSAQQAAGTDQ